MFCPNCGKESLGNFCKNCGQPTGETKDNTPQQKSESQIYEMKDGFDPVYQKYKKYYHNNDKLIVIAQQLGIITAVDKVVICNGRYLEFGDSILIFVTEKQVIVAKVSSTKPKVDIIKRFDLSDSLLASAYNKNTYSFETKFLLGFEINDAISFSFTKDKIVYYEILKRIIPGEANSYLKKKLFMDLNKNNDVSLMYKKAENHSKEVKPKRKIKKRWVLVLIILLVFIIPNIGNEENTKEPPKDAPVSEKTLTFEEKFAKDNNLELELSKNILKASSLIGVDVKEIGYFEKTDIGTGEKAFLMGYNEVSLTVSIGQNNDVSNITSGGFIFYQNGALNYTIQERVLSYDEKGMLMVWTKDAVINNLKSPSTADFAPLEDWKFGKEGQIYKVYAYVDSQNSYGAQIRTEFVLTYQWDGGTGEATITDIII